MAQAAALQASTIGMMEVSKFIDMFDLDEHVETIRQCYAHRCKLMIDTMEATFPEGVTFTHPTGGLFTWVELPEYINTKEMAPQALAQKVAYVPGGSFFPNGGHENCIRLNYSNMPDEKIVTASPTRRVTGKQERGKLSSPFLRKQGAETSAPVLYFRTGNRTLTMLLNNLHKTSDTFSMADSLFNPCNRIDILRNLSYTQNKLQGLPNWVSTRTKNRRTKVRKAKGRFRNTKVKRIAGLASGS
jgi:hypothetical protein